MLCREIILFHCLLFYFIESAPELIKALSYQLDCSLKFEITCEPCTPKDFIATLWNSCETVMRMPRCP